MRVVCLSGLGRGVHLTSRCTYEIHAKPATRHRPESPARFRLPTSVSALPKTKATGADRYTEEGPARHTPAASDPWGEGGGA